MSSRTYFHCNAMKSRLGRFAWVALLLGAQAFAQVPYYRAQMLPTFPNQGWTLGVSLNDAAQVAGLTQMGMAAGWSFADGLRALSGDGQALGIAASSATVVGWSRNAFGRPEAFRWSLDGGGQPMADLYAGIPSYESMAHAVNDSGWALISARASSVDPYRLMLLRPGESALDFGESDTGLYWGGGAASGIVAGSVIVPGNTLRGMVWTEAGGFRSFSVNGGSTEVAGVNGNGWVVGKTALQDAEGRTQVQGFVHDARMDQTMFGWMDFWPHDVNNSGLVVGNLMAGNTRAGNSAAAWNGGAVVDLNTRTAGLGLYELNQAVGVNVHGQILALGSLSEQGVASPPAGAQGLVTFLLSECMRCGQIKPNPNPADVLLDIDPDWFDAFNAQDYRNLGTLQVRTGMVNRADGTLRNLGSLVVAAGATVFNDGGLVVNEFAGRWTVSDGFYNEADGVVRNLGSASFLEGAGAVLGGAGWLNDPGSVFNQSGGAVLNTSVFNTSRASFNQLAGAFSNTVDGRFVLGSSDATFGGEFSNSGRFQMQVDASAPGRSATARVTGSFENRSQGSMALSDRSQFTVQGGSLTSRGTMDLTGAGTALRVEHGGRVQIMTLGGSGSASRLEVGSGADLVVEGQGSELRTDAGTTLAVGLGKLIVRDQGVLINAGTLTNEGSIGVGSGGLLSTEGRLENNGLIQLRGAGTQLLVLPSSDQSHGLVVASRGRLDIAQQAELRVAGRVQILGQADVSDGGFITVDGGNFAVWDRVVGNGSFRQIAGSTYVLNLLQQNELFFESGRVSGIGTIRGQVIFGLDVSRDATLRIAAGNSPGKLTIDGDLTIHNALMELEVADFRRYDRLEVTGNLQLGQFSAVLMPEAGYAPDLNDRIDWLSAGSVSGDLASVQLDATALGGGWIAQAGASANNSRITLDHLSATAWGPDVVAAGTRFTVNAGEITQIASSRHVFSDGDVELRGFAAVRPQAGLGMRDGTFRVAAGGRLTNRGWVYHDIELLNEGLVRNYEDGSIAGLGRFANHGSLENAGSWDSMGGLQNEEGGRVVNHGTIVNRYGPGIVNRGRFENHGVIENHGFITNTESGTFIVAAGGEVMPSGFGLDSYRDFGITRVDGRLAARVIEFQGATVLGSGLLVGQVTGDARFELRPMDTLGIEGELTGFHSFDAWIEGATSFGYLTVNGDVALQGGMLRFLLTEGGYMPQAGDSFKWLRASGSADGLSTLVWRIDVRVPGEDGFDYPWTPSGLLVQLNGDTLSVAAVPEPKVYQMLLVALGMFAGAAWRRRQRRK